MVVSEHVLTTLDSLHRCAHWRSCTLEVPNVQMSCAVQISGQQYTILRDCIFSRYLGLQCTAIIVHYASAQCTTTKERDTIEVLTGRVQTTLGTYHMCQTALLLLFFITLVALRRQYLFLLFNCVSHRYCAMASSVPSLALMQSILLSAHKQMLPTVLATRSASKHR